MRASEVMRKAKDSVRKTIKPTNADRYEQAAKLREKNDKYEQKIRSMEAVQRERERSRRLQERERKANPSRFGSGIQQLQKGSSNRVSNSYRSGMSDPFEVFNSPLFSGSSGTGSGKSGKKGKQKNAEFPDFNFL